VNPAAEHVSGVRAYRDVTSVPDAVDLAVIAVPAADVADVVRACALKRVRGLVVVSGGFADAGPRAGPGWTRSCGSPGPVACG
jgi:acyl-CoA synthetase (NDP forming)